METNTRSRALLGSLPVLALAAALWVPVRASAAGINTTDCSTCTTVNQNQYASKLDVGINGSPSSLPATGTAYNAFVRVIVPGGSTVLGAPKGASPTLVINADGSITCQQLWILVQKTSDGTDGYDDTTNGGGVYPVDVSNNPDFADGGGNWKKSDNFKVSQQGQPPAGCTVVCQDDITTPADTGRCSAAVTTPSTFLRSSTPRAPAAPTPRGSPRSAPSWLRPTRR